MMRPFRWVLVLAISIFSIETLIMWVLSRVHITSAPAEMFIDSCALVLVLAPIIHFVVQRPLAAAANACKRAEERSLRIVEAVPNAIITVGRDGKMLMVNAEAEKLFGYSLAEMVGRSIETLVPERFRARHPGQCGGYFGDPRVRPMGAGRDMFGRRKDGSEVPIETGLSPITTDSGVVVLASIIDISQRKKMENALRESHDGLERRVLERTLELRRAIQEKDRIQAQLLQSQKMEAIGRLTGGISHDFNNLLSAISGYAYFLLNGIPQDDPRHEDVSEIQKCVERASALTRQLMAFSRQQVLQSKVMALNGIVADLQKMLRRLIGEDIVLASVLSEDAGLVKADPGQIEQILVNLVVNARDAMPGGGKISIEVRNEDLGEDAELSPEVRPGSYVLLAVSDTGQGMGPETLERIFEPFFTTKEVGKGTGLGLATVYGIVKQSGGHIDVESEPGRGSTFRIRLPRVQAEPESVAPAARAVTSPGGAETILLVEDDEMVRKFFHRLLVQNGYSVIVASDPEQALSLSAEHHGGIDLLLTDIVMPGMRGDALARRLLAARPEMRVLFTSGYTEAVIVNGALPGSSEDFIQKPVAPAVLLAKLRAVLERQRR